MMAHYFKKQGDRNDWKRTPEPPRPSLPFTPILYPTPPIRSEEMKKLAEADDDSFHNSSWANPQSMKDGMRGTGGVSYRPGGKIL
jgi:hypothetical protein